MNSILFDLVEACRRTLEQHDINVDDDFLSDLQDELESELEMIEAGNMSAMLGGRC